MPQSFLDLTEKVKAETDVNEAARLSVIGTADIIDQLLDDNDTDGLRELAEQMRDGADGLIDGIVENTDVERP